MTIDPSKLAELARYLYPELADQNPAAAVCEAATLIAEATNLLSPPKPGGFRATLHLGDFLTERGRVRNGLAS